MSISTSKLTPSPLPRCSAWPHLTFLPSSPPPSPTPAPHSGYPFLQDITQVVPSAWLSLSFLFNMVNCYLTFKEQFKRHLLQGVPCDFLREGKRAFIEHLLCSSPWVRLRDASDPGLASRGPGLQSSRKKWQGWKSLGIWTGSCREGGK